MAHLTKIFFQFYNVKVTETRKKTWDNLWKCEFRFFRLHIFYSRRCLTVLQNFGKLCNKFAKYCQILKNSERLSILSFLGDPFASLNYSDSFFHSLAHYADGVSSVVADSCSLTNHAEPVSDLVIWSRYNLHEIHIQNPSQDHLLQVLHELSKSTGHIIILHVQPNYSSS